MGLNFLSCKLPSLYSDGIYRKEEVRYQDCKGKINQYE